LKFYGVVDHHGITLSELFDSLVFVRCLNFETVVIWLDRCNWWCVGGFATLHRSHPLPLDEWFFGTDGVVYMKVLCWYTNHLARFKFEQKGPYKSDEFICLFAHHFTNIWLSVIDIAWLI